MGEKTGIAWCDHTFNPWHGCVKISPACTNCYAAELDARFNGTNWGANAPRKFFGDKHWNEPLKWNRAAERDGVRRRVFVASMADVFEDRPDLIPHRQRLWALIAATPHLDWLLLTKRPENLATMVPWSAHATSARGAWLMELGTEPWSNVWLGTTVENQQYADERIPELLQVPAVVHFLSCEPLLGPVNLTRWLSANPVWPETGRLDWVITGCESAHPTKRRDSDADWYRALRDQCYAAHVPFFLKQAREVPLVSPVIIGEGRFVWKGPGSWSKKDGTIELPYLDAQQHAEFPQPSTRTKGEI